MSRPPAERSARIALLRLTDEGYVGGSFRTCYRGIRGAANGTRTHDLLLTKEVLYHLSYSSEQKLWKERRLERVKGIEPSPPAWKAGALPLSYTRKLGRSVDRNRARPLCFAPKLQWSSTVCRRAESLVVGTETDGQSRIRTCEG